jgi:outer membrane protein OmpA-like peptidoglycan-associated protein
MNRARISFRLATGSLLPLAVLIGGCVTAEQQQAARNQLQRAQAAFQQAQTDPNVQTYAQLPLVDAQRALQAAEQTSDVVEMQHLGYLAERKSQTATVVGQLRKMEEESQELRQQTADVLLQKREREAKAARAEAEARARELERARQENEARAQQMERDRMQLDAQARQIAEARQLAEARAREAEARAREVEQTRLQAEQKAREAEQARREVEQKGREVEQARLEAEQKAREAEQARVAAAAAQAQTAALSRELAELRAQETERGVVMTMGDVLFATGKAEVTAGAQRSIDKLADFLRKYPTRNVLIEGHTDSTGGTEANLKLSEQRADAIRDLLVARGVSADRIVTRGYGMQYPLVANDTDAGRQQNRRVEIVILNEGVAAQSVGR